MSQEVIAAVMGSAIILLGGAVGFILVKVLDMRLELTKLAAVVDSHYMLFEVQMQVHAKRLRSPHLRETLDPLIDKFCMRGGELTLTEWKQFYDYCEKEEENQSDMEKRFAAHALKIWALHKLNRDLPMPGAFKQLIETHTDKR